VSEANDEDRGSRDAQRLSSSRKALRAVRTTASQNRRAGGGFRSCHVVAAVEKRSLYPNNTQSSVVRGFKRPGHLRSGMTTELVEGCWRLSLRGVNAYLVEDDVTTLVDAGTPWDLGAIRDGLAAAGTTVSDVDRVLVTHYDLDHVGALAALLAESGATVYAGAADAPLVTGERAPPLDNRKGLFQRLAGRFVDHPDVAVETVHEGDEVGSFTAYETPGHTPGHVAYVSEALDVGLVGDLVTERDGTVSASPWYLSYDTDDVRASVRHLADAAPEFAVLGMGHGDPLLEGGSDTLTKLAAEV
jgi:glyoxylase-like metal-dependent hydrolase (beta-lactamase superfamily II)